jgi:acetyl esterase/lipase
VRGVAGIAGAAYDLDARYAATPMAPMLVPAFGGDVSEWPKAAPLQYVKAGAPPFLLVHGLSDTSAPAAGAQAFAAALRRDGVPTELRLVPGMDHMSVLAGAPVFLADWLAASAKPSGGGERPS